MLTEDEKKLIQFNIALRIYNNCRPHCIQQKQSEERERARCFEQCGRRHRELEEKSKVTLQYNIQ